MLFSILYIFFGIAIIIILIIISFILLYSMLRGAPYAPLGKEKTNTLITLLDIKPGERAIDLGAGDGRIVIALAKAGAQAHGYEINPLLVFLGKQKIKKAGLQGKAHMHWGDIWGAQLTTYNIITVYLTAHIMQRIETKLQNETRPGTKIVVNYFKLPTWKPVRQLDTLYLYQNSKS